MLEYFGHPGKSVGTTAQFAHRALDCMLSCQVRVLIIDDLHFLRWRATSGVEISNHFKYVANEFPVTLVFIGVGLAERGLFSEGDSYSNAVLAQTGRRTTPLDMRPFTVTTQKERREWRQMLLAIEQRLVLADKHPGMLADEHLNQDLLDGVRNDAAAETARREMEAALTSRRITTRVTQPRRRAG